MGHFTVDTLEKFQELCTDGIDFGESPVYDFARCIKKDGEIYGVSPGETCKEGKPISDAKAKGKGDGKSSARMSKLRAAFIKRTGREMTAKELEKAKNMIMGLKDLAPKGKGKGDLKKLVSKTK
jgi:hypothetical protein